MAHDRRKRHPRAPARRWGEKRGLTADESARREALGRSQGGFSTKVHMACDSLGTPLAFVLTPGQRHESPQAEGLISSVITNEQDAEVVSAVLADKGYDSDALVEYIEDLGVEAVIPPRSNRIDPRNYDAELYAERNQVECLFARLKQYRRVATRYEKRARNYLSMLHVASAMVWLL